MFYNMPVTRNKRLLLFFIKGKITLKVINSRNARKTGNIPFSYDVKAKKIF